MAAGAEGRTVHYRSRKGGDWVLGDALSIRWNWGINEYRAEGVEMRTLQTVQPPAGVFGNTSNRNDWFNPENFTDEQVGVAEGWRLITVAENDARGMRSDCSMWNSPGWGPVCGLAMGTGQTFRTRSPLPQQTSQVYQNETLTSIPAEPALQGPWHNPQRLESAGEGYRFLLQSELDHTPPGTQYYRNWREDWGDRRTHSSPAESSVTYRVPVQRLNPLSPTVTTHYLHFGNVWDNRPIQNPAGVTTEQLGEGWRFCLVSEMDQLPTDGEAYGIGGIAWSRSGYREMSVPEGRRLDMSYRTRTPLPPSTSSEPISLQTLYHEDAALIAELNSPIVANALHPTITIPDWVRNGPQSDQLTEIMDDPWESIPFHTIEDDEDVPMAPPGSMFNPIER